eukprot:6182692-Pleurochrysis_carterae.AAC.1
MENDVPGSAARGRARRAGNGRRTSPASARRARRGDGRRAVEQRGAGFGKRVDADTVARVGRARGPAPGGAGSTERGLRAMAARAPRDARRHLRHAGALARRAYVHRRL